MTRFSKLGFSTYSTPLITSIGISIATAGFLAFMAPSTHAQARSGPGKNGAKSGVPGSCMMDTGGISTGFSGGSPAAHIGPGGGSSCSGMGGAEASIGEASCPPAQSPSVTPPLGGLNGASLIYEKVSCYTYQLWMVHH